MPKQSSYGASVVNVTKMISVLALNALCIPIVIRALIPLVALGFPFVAPAN
jgi:hypothetical protein